MIRLTIAFEDLRTREQLDNRFIIYVPNHSFLSFILSLSPPPATLTSWIHELSCACRRVVVDSWALGLRFRTGMEI